MNDLHKIEGILYGLAIGDCFGYPTEFMLLEDIKARFGPSGIQKIPDPPLFTDDTQMTMAIAEALARSGEKDTHDIMVDIGGEFVKWLDSPENNRAPGMTCIAGARELADGVPWTESGDPGSMGCGSAMRVAPIGYLFQHDIGKLVDVAIASSICTHAHPGAIAASVAAAWLVKAALDKVPQNELISGMKQTTLNMSKDFDEAVEKLEQCLNWPDEEKALSYLGDGWIGPEAVVLALFCFLRHSESYVDTIVRAANTDGDSDSIACIAGSISGAYHGIGAIPPKWTTSIEKSDYIRELANRLAQKKEHMYGHK